MTEKTKEKKQIEKSAEKKTNKSASAIKIPTRGRIFKGTIVQKFTTRVTIEFERTLYIQKYERYLKKTTRIHARLPEGMQVEEGDLVKIQECRPLSKIIHFMVIEKISPEKNFKGKVGKETDKVSIQGDSE
jgi:small subunit ribosomal protein S17